MIQRRILQSVPCIIRLPSQRNILRFRFGGIVIVVSYMRIDQPFHLWIIIHSHTIFCVHLADPGSEIDHVVLFIQVLDLTYKFRR